MRPLKIKAAIFVSCALSAGLWIAAQFNSHLDIQFDSKSLPAVPAYQATDREKPFPKIETIDAISIPTGASNDDRYQMAVAKLADAIEMRTGTKPEVVESPVSSPSGHMVAIGSQSGIPRAPNSDFRPLPSEGFSVRSSERENRRILTIAGGGRMGDVYGTYWLADKLYSAVTDKDLFGLNTEVAPELPYRLVDCGGVGIVPDAASWGNDYSHHNRAFQDVILVDDPYVNEQAFERVKAEFKQYIHRMFSCGFNGIVFDGFLEFVNFNRVGSGFEVYGADSPYRRRHLRLAKRFSELFSYAHSMGMKVLLRTDMLALTKPLERYFRERFGGLKITEDEFWEVYRQGLEELFDVYPYLEGVVIRIGEGGAIYNLDGWLYYSALEVKTEKAVKVMLRAFLNAVAAKGKKIFFRNWSVGVGRIGDMHTNPQTYENVLGEFSSPNLVVSTKYGRGDFTSYLPYNPTFENGTHARNIEFQARREFEAFNAFPNYLGPFHQTTLQALLKQNPKIEGMWLWTQRGGPLRAGPLSLYPFHGFWLFIDANVYVTGRLAWNPKASVEDLTRIWVRRHFGDDPQMVDSITQLMLLSREAVLKGHYISGFARKQVRACGLEVPPNVWIWDIPIGSSSALSAVYYTCRHMLAETVAEGFQAVAAVRHMKDLANAPDREKIQNVALYEKLLASLNYEENLFETLAWYRRAFLYHYHWLDTGDPQSYRIWREAYAKFGDVKRIHLSTYGNSMDFPAYNFYAADAGMDHAKRSTQMIWVARCLLIAALGLFFAGSRAIQDRTDFHRGKRGLRALWVALFKPWAFSDQGQWFSADRFFVCMLPLMLIGLSLLTFSSFLSPHFFGWIFSCVVVFVSTLTFTHRSEARSTLPLQAAVLAPTLGLAVLFMAVISVRGPLYLWYVFWTSPGFRILFLSVGIGCMFWMGFTVFAVAQTVFKASALQSAGNLLIAVGAVVLLNASLAGAIGLEAFLTALNDEMAVIPLSLSRVLGITTHLNINPHVSSDWTMGGALLGAVGWVMTRIERHLASR
jgi:hypothetical protein